MFLVAMHGWVTVYHSCMMMGTITTDVCAACAEEEVTPSCCAEETPTYPVVLESADCCSDIVQQVAVLDDAVRSEQKSTIADGKISFSPVIVPAILESDIDLPRHSIAEVRYIDSSPPPCISSTILRL